MREIKVKVRYTVKYEQEVYTLLYDDNEEKRDYMDRIHEDLYSKKIEPTDGEILEIENLEEM